MFTNGQLMLIKSAARGVKNQGEVAVYNSLRRLRPNDFTEVQFGVIKYCAEECRRQRSGEFSVYDMLRAWHHADMFPPTEGMVAIELLDFIQEIGATVEPFKNVHGYRRVSVGIMTDGVWNEKVPWSSIERLMNQLAVSWCEGDYKKEAGYLNHPKAKDEFDQFYYDYEEIHPWLDGNGRSGKIIYNWLKGTLNDPVLPPLFWEGSIP